MRARSCVAGTRVVSGTVLSPRLGWLGLASALLEAEREALDLTYPAQGAGRVARG